MKCIGQNLKPVVVMVAVNFALAIVNILFKKIIDEGTDHMVIVTYRLAIAAVFLLPIVYIKERKSRHKLTISILCQLFFSAIFGSSLTQYLFLFGLEYTSATFSCAFLNLVPAITLILAVLLRLEKVNIKVIAGKAKLIGTLICIGGVFLLALYKGKPLALPDTEANSHMTNNENLANSVGKTEKLAIGSVYLITGCSLWSLWFIIQARIGRRYPFQYTSTAILSFFGAIQSALLSLISKRNVSMWVLKGNYEILSVIYSGVVGSGLCYVGMSWCVEQKGPIFTSAFIPFAQIFAAVISFSFQHKPIYVGSILGSILVIVGLYVLLWGKSNDTKDDSVSKQTQVAEDDRDCIPVSITPPSINLTGGK